MSCVIIFITSGSGIGLALAKQAASRGYNLILADINQDCLENAKQILGLDSNVLRVKVCDVSKENEIQELADYSFEQFGNLFTSLLIMNPLTSSNLM